MVEQFQNDQWITDYIDAVESALFESGASPDECKSILLDIKHQINVMLEEGHQSRDIVAQLDDPAAYAQEYIPPSTPTSQPQQRAL